MFTIEVGSSFEPNSIYKAPTCYEINNRFDTVVQIKNDSYLKFE